MLFKSNNTQINLIKLDDESDSLFNLRGELALKIKNNTDDYNDSDIEKFTKIWINIKYKGCKYSNKIYNIIKQFDDDI